MSKTVLITGASSGIGLNIALMLANKNYNVFAGVRKESDGHRIKKLNSKIITLLLDVNNPTHLQDGFDLLSKRKLNDFILINNAGIALTAPMETFDIKELRKMFDVNFFGLISATQKFLPLLRQNNGYIINMSSVAGLSSSPFLGGYSASKHALEAATDSMRWELQNANIKVTLIEPGPIKTPIWDKGLNNKTAIDEAIPQLLKDYYRKPLKKFLNQVISMEKIALDTEKVGEAVLSVLESKNPPPRIMVTDRQRKFQMLFSQCIPQRFFDKLVQKMIFT